MDKIIYAIISGSIPTITIISLLIFFPEKVEKWIAILSNLFSKIFYAVSFFKKNYIKFDLQGRINNYIKNLSSQVPNLSANKCKLEWIDNNETRKAFLNKGEVVLRLRKSDTNDENFVHGAYLFVSNCLLRHAKRHISINQKISLDVFVTGEIIKKRKNKCFRKFYRCIFTSKIRKR